MGEAIRAVKRETCSQGTYVQTTNINSQLQPTVNLPLLYQCWCIPFYVAQREQKVLVQLSEAENRVEV